MENYDIKSRVYALLDEQGRVTRIEGEYSLPADLTGWTLIEEGAPCDRLNLAQSHYLDPPLYTEDGLLAWRYTGGALALRADEELEAERAALPVQMRTHPTVSISGNITLRRSDMTVRSSSTVYVDAGGVGAALLKIATADLTAGDIWEAFLAPQNYLSLYAEL